MNPKNENLEKFQDSKIGNLTEFRNSKIEMLTGILDLDYHVYAAPQETRRKQEAYYSPYGLSYNQWGGPVMTTRDDILRMLRKIQANWLSWQHSGDESELAGLSHAITGDLDALITEMEKDEETISDN